MIHIVNLFDFFLDMEIPQHPMLAQLELEQVNYND